MSDSKGGKYCKYCTDKRVNFFVDVTKVLSHKDRYWQTASDKASDKLSITWLIYHVGKEQIL